LDRSKRLSTEKSLEILNGVCAGLDAAHQRHLIHRDIKPENIFLARAGAQVVPKVLDFGIAKFLPTAPQPSDQTAAGLLLGSLKYMSPEQFSGDVVDARADLWALGVVTYEMLTGAHPFPFGTMTENMAAVLFGKFTPVANHLPDAPPSLQNFFAVALSPDAGARNKSAREFYTELERTLDRR
jgi:serine/threonine protein kinase